jgi:hypothetical protein
MEGWSEGCTDRTACNQLRIFGSVIYGDGCTVPWIINDSRTLVMLGQIGDSGKICQTWKMKSVSKLLRIII